MDVQEAVRVAKDYVRSVYKDEQIENLGLEEIKLDDSADTWRITIGFSRPWDAQRGFAAALTDVTLLAAADDREILTTDLDLDLAALGRGCKATNFVQLRDRMAPLE